MKLWSKEALTLGGMSYILITFFTFFNYEFVSDGIFVIFLLGILMLSFNHPPKFVTYMINQYPNLSYYLSAVGWIIYFAIIGLIGIVVAAAAFEWTDATLENMMKIFNFICAWGIPISLLVAFIKKVSANQHGNRIS